MAQATGAKVRARRGRGGGAAGDGPAKAERKRSMEGLLSKGPEIRPAGWVEQAQASEASPQGRWAWLRGSWARGIAAWTLAR